MVSEGDLKKRVARKLTRKRREGYRVTMEIPERFRDGDDADEDCTAVHGTNALMNQSVFGMIAAAGSQVDFNARFDGQSSDDEDESRGPSLQASDLHVAKTTDKAEKHRRKFSENKLLRSLPRLVSRSKSKSKSSPKHSSSPGPESSSELSPVEDVQETRPARMPSRDAPVMSRMLEAKTELAMRPSFDTPRLSGDNTGTDAMGEATSSSLARRLMEIFHFDQAEEVIEGMFSRWPDISKA
jgi:sterol 3beta-glucosyltransferase